MFTAHKTVGYSKKDVLYAVTTTLPLYSTLSSKKEGLTSSFLRSEYFTTEEIV